MALAGNIKEFGLADIFQIVSLQKKTGELTIESSAGKVTVVLEKGLIVGADATFRPVEERLEQTLIRSQQISQFQLKRAKETQKKTLQPLWTALAETGGIDTGTLQKALSQQVHETVYQALRWTEGEYRFEPRKSVEYDKQLLSPINTEFLIMEGFRITDEWSELEKEISSLQLVVRRAPGASASKEDLSEAEWKVYTLLAVEKTIQEVIDSSQLGEFDTCQMIYDLMRKNLAEKVRKKGKTRKVYQLPFDLKEVFSKGATLFVGIGIVVGVILLFTVIPENFGLIHKPRVNLFRPVKPLTARAQLYNLSHLLLQYFLAQKDLPTSFDDLVQKGLITSQSATTDPWGNTYFMKADPARKTVMIWTNGEDKVPDTNDEIRVEIAF